MNFIKKVLDRIKINNNLNLKTMNFIKKVLDRIKIKNKPCDIGVVTSINK